MQIFSSGIPAGVGCGTLSIQYFSCHCWSPSDQFLPLLEGLGQVPGTREVQPGLAVTHLPSWSPPFSSLIVCSLCSPRSMSPTPALTWPIPPQAVGLEIDRSDCFPAACPHAHSDFLQCPLRCHQPLCLLLSPVPPSSLLLSLFSSPFPTVLSFCSELLRFVCPLRYASLPLCSADPQCPSLANPTCPHSP